MHDMIDIMRQQAISVLGGREGKGTLLCTAYNPKTHAVKGILMPHEVETGWIPVAVVHAGSGHGVLVGPKVGDPSKAADGFDGDIFDVEFDGGDPNTPVAKMKHFSAQNQPPEVQSGEILVNHASGMRDKYSADGSRTQTHPNGASDMWDKDGNMARNLKGKAEMVIAGLVKNDVAKKVVTGVVHLATG